jgi:hypothetical protein
MAELSRVMETKAGTWAMQRKQRKANDCIGKEMKYAVDNTCYETHVELRLAPVTTGYQCPKRQMHLSHLLDYAELTL